MVDFTRRWAGKTGLATERLLEWLDLSSGKFYDWAQRYGRTNQHNGSVPRDFSGCGMRRSGQFWTSRNCTRWKATGG